jgi:predicted ATP-grasp superfamily ATP-dependent carboligase
VSVFAAHVGGCRGRLPRFDLDAARRGAGAVGKAVLYARRAVVAPDTRRWLASPAVRDVPRSGERISRGRPLCTIFAHGADGAGCERALARHAARMYAGLERQAARGRRRSA